MHEQQYQISTCNAHVTCNKLVQLVTVKMAGKKQATLNLFISRPTKNIDVPGDDEVTDHHLDDSIQDESPEVPAITDPITSSGSHICSAQCCDNYLKAFQPKDDTTIKSLKSATGKAKSFQTSWYCQFPWVTVCVTRKRVFCLYCRHAEKYQPLTFSRCGEKVFTEVGFQNWKKAIEKFRCHEGSRSHQEAKEKWIAQKGPTIDSQLSTQLKKSQESRRAGFLKQVRAIKYLTRQGIALQGHRKMEGNLQQLLLEWSHDHEVIKAWLSENRYTCHQTVNELIDLMGQSLLRSLLLMVRSEQCPPWYSIIADEATDVCNNEQLSLCIRWVDNMYVIREETIGLFRVPDTKAETLYVVIKDLLVRCSLSIEMCRGQAYDGAANMQGCRSGLATRILSDNPAALPVHCYVHSLNLCLQDVGRNIICIRDALELVREVGKLIKLSPKRLHLFSTRLSESDECTVSLKSLCTTRWTARTGAIDAILKDFKVLSETLEEIYETTRDEYGLKAYGFLQSLEKFETIFGLMLSYNLFSTTEQVSLTLQKKNIGIRDALTVIEAAKLHLKQLRSEFEFDHFYNKVVSFAEKHEIEQPVLPRRRKRPKRYDDYSGTDSHVFADVKSYYRKMYFEACDLLFNDLENRFEARFISPMLCMEQLLIKAARNEKFETEMATIQESCFSKDINFSELSKQLPLLHDMVKTSLPSVKSVTSLHTICDAMKTNQIFKEMFSSVHLMLRLILTSPITSATAERTFSALKHLYTYDRSTMTEKRLNNCLLLHVHKDPTDSLDLVSIAQEFVLKYDDRKKYFGNFIN